MGRAAAGVVLAVSLGALAAGCGDDPPATSSTARSTSTTAPEPTTSAVGAELRDCGGVAPSDGTFDPVAGTYYVLLMGIDAEARTLDVDVLQLLTGHAAADAYHEEFPDDPEGPPNGFWSVNENPTVHKVRVAPDVEVRLVRLQEDGDADLDPGTFEELPAYLADDAPRGEPQLSWNPFWLTLADGGVTDICEQYIP